MTREELIQAIMEADLSPEEKKARRKKWGKRAAVGAGVAAAAVGASQLTKGNRAKWARRGHNVMVKGHDREIARLTDKAIATSTGQGGGRKALKKIRNLAGDRQAHAHASKVYARAERMAKSRKARKKASKGWKGLLKGMKVEDTGLDRDEIIFGIMEMAAPKVNLIRKGAKIPLKDIPEKNWRKAFAAASKKGSKTKFEV